MATIDIMAYGAKGDGNTNDTAAISAAIAAAQSGDVVRVPTGRFMVDVNSIKLKPGVTLQVNGTLAAQSNSLNNYVIVDASADDAVVTGLGVIEGDRYRHAGNTGEWGFGIAIRGKASRVAVRGVNITACWGDGIYIDDAKLVGIDGVTLSKNRRQGMSVVAVDGLNVLHSTLRDNGGTAPGCGIDLECDRPDQTIANVIISSNSFSNNVGSGVAIGSPNGSYRNIAVRGDNTFDMKTQPIWVSGNAGSLGTSPIAFLLNRLFSWVPGYRWWGYPTQWQSK